MNNQSLDNFLDVGLTIGKNGSDPLKLKCPFCHALITTRVEKSTNETARKRLIAVDAAFFFVITALIIVLVVFIMDSGFLRKLALGLGITAVTGSFAVCHLFWTNRFYKDITHFCPNCTKQLGVRDGFEALKSNQRNAV